ncbi:MAG TPA: hypothetical protein VFQ54_02480 [Thermomicrobiales bacterium]|nr:hypothetical protein [Thermomicrobiales bacterium]
MKQEDAWTATVLKKSRALFDGSNLYRQVTIRRDDDETETIRVNRALWKEINVGDRLVKDPGQEPRRE